MKKIKYDLAFSLGSACSCTSALRAAGLQFASFPFDWLFGTDLPGRVRLIADDFKAWLDASSLRTISPPSWHHLAIYENTRTGIVFNHDFPQNVPLADCIDRVVEKYDRRIERLKRLIEMSKRVLAVFVSTPLDALISDDVLKDCQARLAAKFAGRQVDLLYFHCQRGRPPHEADVRSLSDGAVTVVSFDYGATKKVHYDYEIDTATVAKWLAKRYAVADYRTPEERATYEAARRRALLKKYNAKNRYELFVNRLVYRLYRHFQKCVERKGEKCE